MKKILEFIEKHSKFIAKVILIFLYLIIAKYLSFEQLVLFFGLNSVSDVVIGV